MIVLVGFSYSIVKCQLVIGRKNSIRVKGDVFWGVVQLRNREKKGEGDREGVFKRVKGDGSFGGSVIDSVPS